MHDWKYTRDNGPEPAELNGFDEEWRRANGWCIAAGASIGEETLDRCFGLSVEVFEQDRGGSLLVTLAVGNSGYCVLCPTIWDYLHLMRHVAPVLAMARQEADRESREIALKKKQYRSQ